MRRSALILLACAWGASPLRAEPPPPAPPAAAPTEPDATALAKDLASTDLETRRKAAYALWGLAEKAAPALPALAKGLADDDDYVRTTAGKTLLRVAPLALGASELWTATFAALRDVLNDVRPAVRASAAMALWSLGVAPDGAEPLAETALRLLADDDADLSANGAGILANVAGALTPALQPLRDKAVAALVPLAADKDDRVRRAVADALGQLGMPDGMEALFTLTKDPEAKVRAVALAALGGMPASGEESARRLVALKAALFEADPEVRASAANTFWAMGWSAAGALADLGKALREDPEATVRAPAVAALGALGDRSALGFVRAAVDDRDDTVRASAVAALAEFGPDAAPHLPLLVHLLKGGGGDGLVVSAAMTLGRLGYVAASAVPALEKAVTADAPETRRFALNALYSLALNDALPEDCVTTLLAALARPDTAREAALVLATLPRLPATAGPWLRQAFIVKTDEDDVGRRTLLVALEHVEGPAEQQTLALVRPLAGDADDLPRAAALALLVLGTEADRARGLDLFRGMLAGPDALKAVWLLPLAGRHARALAPALAQRFRDLPDTAAGKAERFRVAATLASLGGEASAEAVEHLRKMLLGSDNLTAARSAAEVLGKMEDPPPAVLDALVSRLEDPDGAGDVAVAAAVAVRRLGCVDAHTLALLAKAADHPRNGALRLAAGHALLVLAGR